jgi:hypothetical protein
MSPAKVHELVQQRADEWANEEKHQYELDSVLYYENVPDKLLQNSLRRISDPTARLRIYQSDAENAPQDHSVISRKSEQVRKARLRTLKKKLQTALKGRRTRRKMTVRDAAKPEQVPARAKPDGTLKLKPKGVSKKRSTRKARRDIDTKEVCAPRADVGIIEAIENSILTLIKSLTSNGNT